MYLLRSIKRNGLTMRKTFARALRRQYRQLVLLACGISVFANISFFFVLDSTSCRCQHDGDGESEDVLTQKDLVNKVISAIRNEKDTDSIKQDKDCNLTDTETRLYPQCKGKIEWMSRMWMVDPCYKSYGVDGSNCSFLSYLSEVEGWCPKKSWQGKNLKPKENTNIIYANTTTDLKPLMCILVDPNERETYTWIKRRIRRMWKNWSKAIYSLQQKQNLQGRVRKKILLYLGFAANKTGWHFIEDQFAGGPLGELVQWTDLISSLYILGHDITVTSELEDLESVVLKLPAVNAPCQNLNQLPIDIIYTDIVGLKQFRDIVKDGYPKFRCLVRVLDTFGTEPEFNSKIYSTHHKLESYWSGQDLDTQQFFTFFPHSPDNSFMGFVAEQQLSGNLGTNISKYDIAVVYGKMVQFFHGKEFYLDLINRFFRIHTTVEFGKFGFPEYVINHGLLRGKALHELLRHSKVFVGLGFPYEGPAPLEAIAEGAVFINPRFIPPHNRDNTEEFADKPTRRGLTSQHPYAEQFIGEPFVYTVDIYNYAEMMTTLTKIKERSVFHSHLPYEFTEEGMLQRINAYVENQNFCLFQRRPSKWPPPQAVSFVLGKPGQSCKDVCWEKDLICERSYFLDLNSAEIFKKHGISCSNILDVPDLCAPAYLITESSCLLQIDELFFSCVGGNDFLRRLCPCRTYIKGQTALCKGCER